MTTILKQTTAVIVRVGPFVDVGDGFTPETGITLGAADEAEAMKAGGGASVDISARTWAAVTGCAGWYDLSLSTADTGTVGDLTIVVQDASVCLPVFTRFQVIEEAIYDSLYAASAAGFDANQRVDIGGWLGTAPATPTVAGVPEVDLTHMEGGTQTVTDLKDFADAGYDPATNKVEGVKLADTLTTYTSNTVQTGDSFARIGAAGASLTDLGGMSTGMQAEVATEVGTGLSNAGIVLTTATIETVTSQTQLVVPATADATDDDAYNGCLAVLIDGTDPNQRSVRLVTDYASGTRTVTLDAAPDFTVTTSDTMVLLAASVLRTADAAISVTTYAEPAAGAPPAAPTPAEMMRYPYFTFRNKKTQTTSTWTVRNDADSADLWKSTLTDASGTFTKTEIISG